MRKRTKNIILIFLLVALLSMLVVPIALNYDKIFSDGILDKNEEPLDDYTDKALVVKCNGQELDPNRSIEVEVSTLTFTVDSDEFFTASFINVSDYPIWEYQVDDTWCRFQPNIGLLNHEIGDGTYTIEMPYDIMDWVLRNHNGVTEDQVKLPTDVNHNVPYIAIKVVIGETEYLYPIKYDLNGGWTKVVLEPSEIIF